MVGLGARIDHIPDRPSRDSLDRGDDLLTVRRRARIDNHHAIVADLDGDVGPGAGNHGEVRPQLQHLQVAGAGCHAVVLPCSPARLTGIQRCGNCERRSHCDGYIGSVQQDGRVHPSHQRRILAHDVHSLALLSPVDKPGAKQS